MRKYLYNGKIISSRDILQEDKVIKIEAIKDVKGAFNSGHYTLQLMKDGNYKWFNIGEDYTKGQGYFNTIGHAIISGIDIDARIFFDDEDVTDSLGYEIKHTNPLGF